MHQGLTLLHDDNVEASRNFLELWGETGGVLTGTSILSFTPAFPGCPCVVYEDAEGARHIFFNPVTVQAVLDWKASVDLQMGALEVTLDNVKASAVKVISDAVKAYILAAYPLDKQLNIIRIAAGYTEADSVTMASFIDEARTLANQGIEAVRAAETKEDVEGILATLRSQYANDIPV